MMCERPYQAMPGTYVSCGSCLYCRINKARVWQSRILMEEMCWEESCFATLTLDDIHVSSDFSVNPKALQKFMKRLRRRCEPFNIRFYGVGEYGDPLKCPRGLGRPHYHIALFGVGVDVGFCEFRKKEVYFSRDRVVEKSWKCGDTHIGLIEKASARYLTDYVTKFMNFRRSKKLSGRHPEFARMSNRPGIGAPAMRQVAAKLIQAGYNKECVVSELNYGKKKLPLGRYLKEVLHNFRGGDLLAKDREVRNWLDDIGIKYCDFRGGFSLSPNKGYKTDVLELNSPNDNERRSIYSFHLGESKAKRHTITANRRQFKQKRSL